MTRGVASRKSKVAGRACRAGLVFIVIIPPETTGFQRACQVGKYLTIGAPANGRKMMTDQQDNPTSDIQHSTSNSSASSAVK
ncbi:MAG: hypothetical protein D6732_24345 [Methanobacteriota archaeon]|nr:MAG: hypothetical protein D6732_24345 [Euryarchaeota archaeon]